MDKTPVAAVNRKNLIARMNSPYADRCLGCLLGTASGDILGASVEGWDASRIRAAFGQLRDFLDHGRGFGRYTDDTQMTLARRLSAVDVASEP